MSVARWALLDVLIIGNGHTRVDYRGLCVYVLEVKKKVSPMEHRGWAE